MIAGLFSLESNRKGVRASARTDCRPAERFRFSLLNPSAACAGRNKNPPSQVADATDGRRFGRDFPKKVDLPALLHSEFADFEVGGPAETKLVRLAGPTIGPQCIALLAKTGFQIGKAHILHLKAYGNRGGTLAPVVAPREQGFPIHSFDVAPIYAKRTEISTIFSVVRGPSLPNKPRSGRGTGRQAQSS